MHGKTYRPFLCLLIISIALMTYQNRTGRLNPFGFLRDWANSLNDRVQSSVSYIYSTSKKMTMRDEELKRLKKEVDSLKTENAKAKEALLEAERLRRLLGLKETAHGYVTSARVIGRGGARWSETFLIDKGSSDGIEKDMAVITPDGLLGKIASAEPSYSLILLINDMKFSASVRLEQTRQEAVLSGTGAKSPILKYIPLDKEVKKGEGVITSGLDMLFPEGIPVGKVNSVSKEGDGLFYRVEVSPSVNARSVEEAVVIRLIWPKKEESGK
jgi:rod shape-determining protein MreC